MASTFKDVNVGEYFYYLYDHINIMLLKVETTYIVLENGLQKSINAVCIHPPNLKVDKIKDSNYFNFEGGEMITRIGSIKFTLDEA